jgi:putative transposase
VWLYHKFTLGFRDIDQLLAARGIKISYETIRNWCEKVTKKPMVQANQDSHR